VIHEAPLNIEAHGIVPGSSGQSAKLSALSRRYAGATMYAPPGIYGGADWTPCRLYGGLVAPGAVFRVPELAYSALYAQGAATAPLRALTFSGFRLESTARVDQHLGGNGLSGAASNAFMLDHVDGFDITGLEVHGRFNMGFHFRDAHHGQTHNLVATGTDYDGLHNTAGSSDITHHHSQIRDSGDDCLAVISYDTDDAPCKRIVFVEPTAEGSRRARTLTFEGCVDSGVRGGTLTKAAGRGVLINYGGINQTTRWVTTRAFVDGTTVRETGEQGIDFNGRNRDCWVRAQVYGSTDELVRVFAARNARVTVNGADNLNGNGITVRDETAIGTQVRASTIRRSATRGIYDEGTATHIIGNEIDEPGAEAIVAYNPAGTWMLGNRAVMRAGARTAFAVTGKGAARLSGNVATWDGKVGTETFVAAAIRLG
jgi:hypothetical protein